MATTTEVTAAGSGETGKSRRFVVVIAAIRLGTSLLSLGQYEQEVCCFWFQNKFGDIVRQKGGMGQSFVWECPKAYAS